MSVQAKNEDIAKNEGIAREKVIIIGSGPAGYTAAIYAARAQLQPILFEGFYSGVAGGQLMTTTEVENYPGFPHSVTGSELMQQFKEQAIRFGTRFLPEDVVSIDFSQRPYKVEGSSTTLEAYSIIIATGATAKRLDIPGTGDNEFWQKGVSACAVCDGAAPIFRNKELFVVGGGDSAMEEALFLTRYAAKVHIVHRRDAFRASKIMADRAMKHPKVNIFWDSIVSEVKGNKVVQSVIIENLKNGTKAEYPAGGLFFAVGHVPNTQFLNGQLDVNEIGYLLVEPGTTSTKFPGVYAAGDVQDHVYRQAITAAGTGCMAAIEAERELAALDL